MPARTELIQSETGLIHRLRRGQPHAGLIVMLHGLSGDENVMWVFDHALPRSATVIAPRALFASELGGYSWTRSVAHDNADGVDFQEASVRLSRFVNEVIPLYQVDAQRVILMGFSQGAALSYAYSLAHPEMLRGVIALAGFLPHQSSTPPPPDSAHAFPGTPPTPRWGVGQVVPAERERARQNALPHYLIIHGTHDEAVPIDRAREARSVLEGRGAAVEYHEHRVGHKVSAQGMQEIAHWVNKSLEEV